MIKYLLWDKQKTSPEVKRKDDKVNPQIILKEIVEKERKKQGNRQKKRKEEENLLSRPVNPSTSVGVNVDQNQTFH